MTVREMLARIGADELDDWAAYERVCGPLGGERLDVLAGVIAAAAYNAQRTRNSDPITSPESQIPKWDQGKAKPVQSWQDQLAAVRQLNSQFGGRTTAAG